MKVMNRFSLALLFPSLVGCVALDQVAQGIPPTDTPVMLTESLPQICQAAENNQVQANSTYIGKGLRVTGEVQSVQESFQPHYRVLLHSDEVNIHAGTENKANVTSLVVGTTARVSGIVSNVSYDYSGCSISLKDATFS